MKSSSCIRKLDRPVLTKDDIPYNARLIFNAGVTKYNGKYVMTFRNDYCSDDPYKLTGTNIGFATSDDGIHWDVAPEPCFVMEGGEYKRAYDPRLTVIDGVCYMCFALDTQHGLCGGIAKTEEFAHFDVVSVSEPDNRNMVLFPEKIGGNFVRLDRPMPVYSRRHRDRFDLWLSESPDLEFWGRHRLVCGVEDVPFADDKIGPAAPPVRTDKGWLTTFHAVALDPTRGKNGWEDRWQKSYAGGIMLLDLDNPSKVLGLYKKPLLVCDLPYEEEDGFRKDVIFPGGMILEDDGTVRIYYGASDTVECMAEADADELIRLCLEGDGED